MPVRKPKSCPHRTRFGKNIVSLRGRRKLTQEKLAEKIGTHPPPNWVQMAQNWAKMTSEGRGGGGGRVAGGEGGW